MVPSPGLIWFVGGCPVEHAGLTARLASVSDAACITDIYNEGIEDRIATFETEPRTVEQIAAQLVERGDGFPTVVVERDGWVIAWAGAGPYAH